MRRHNEEKLASRIDSAANIDMHVAIVGAGPSGLILATALRRRGIKATLFEREADPAKLFVGAGVNLMQPVISVLQQEGLMEGVAKCNNPASYFSFHDAKTNNTIRSVDLRARYGAPYYTVRRGDLTAALLQGLPGEGPRFGEDVESIEEILDLLPGVGPRASGSRLCFKDGSTTSEIFDVVVGANGIDSSIRAHVQYGTKVAQTESIAINIIGVAPANGLKSASPTIAQALRDRPDFTVYLDPSMTLLMAHVTPTKVMWGVALNAKDFPPEDGPIDLRKKLSDHLNSCKPAPSPFVKCAVTAFLTHTPASPDPDAPYLWRLRDIDPLPTYVRNNIALIGDAAHAQLPWTGLGISAAALDAQRLADALALGE
jgi:salicylate hydroxylase